MPAVAMAVAMAGMGIMAAVTGVTLRAVAVVTAAGAAVVINSQTETTTR
ncbi:MAG: hypothetical protein NVS3B11_28450 [Collimonas sp.]